MTEIYSCLPFGTFPRKRIPYIAELKKSLSAKNCVQGLFSTELYSDPIGLTIFSSIF